MSSNGRDHADHTRIVLRPIGSSLPLGFYSFGIGMLLLGCLSIANIGSRDGRRGFRRCVRRPVHRRVC